MSVTDGPELSGRQRDGTLWRGKEGSGLDRVVTDWRSGLKRAGF
jgi:hypothetical protein